MQKTTRASVHEPDPVRPTKEDEVAAAGSELIGGPLGRRALLGTPWWTPVRVIVLVAIGMFALGMVQKLPCYNGAWFFGASSQYTHACYSDIPHLYKGRGFADGLVPYFDKLARRHGVPRVPGADRRVHGGRGLADTGRRQHPAPGADLLDGQRRAC